MSIHEECGVFGIFNRNLEHNAVQETYLALYALQHRGQVSCGIAARNGDNVDCITELGTVPEVFNKDKLASLTALGNGNVAIGHVRYSAQGEEDEINSQPMVMSYAKGSISIVNNGSLVSTAKLRNQLEAGGSVFQTNSNAEMIVHLIVRHRLQTENIEKAISKASGVGAKTAARIILELKDKLMKSSIGMGEASSFSPDISSAKNVSSGTIRSKISEAQDALAVLGYNRMQITSALSTIDTASLSLEEIIKAALKKLI